jgi:hypothetical protein
MKPLIRIPGIAGSLRRGSFNRAALQAATKLPPKDATVGTFELGGIPPFNQDEEQNPTAKVTELKKRILGDLADDDRRHVGDNPGLTGLFHRPKVRALILSRNAPTGSTLGKSVSL